VHPDTSLVALLSLTASPIIADLSAADQHAHLGCGELRPLIRQVLASEYLQFMLKLDDNQLKRNENLVSLKSAVAGAAESGQSHRGVA
jgi:hypothetical protein